MRQPEKILEIREQEEAEKAENKKVLESGYSESEQAKDVEIRSGDLQSLKKSNAFQQLHGSARTLVAYQTVSRQLSDLVARYTKLMERDLHQAQKMHSEIARIRGMQKLLLTKLFGKLPEEIADKEILEELGEFI